MLHSCGAGAAASHDGPKDVEEASSSHEEACISQQVACTSFGLNMCKSIFQIPSISCLSSSEPPTHRSGMDIVLRQSGSLHRELRYNGDSLQRLYSDTTERSKFNSRVKPYNKKLCHCCQTLAAFLMGTGAVRNFFRVETLGAHF